MTAINYSGQYMHGHDFRIKIRTGSEIYNATGDAICGELLLATGDNGAGLITGVLYVATQTTSDAPATIIKLSEGTEEI
jgi:hypothetical protein